MSIARKAHLIIYRIRQKGLEVFLVNHDLHGEDWHLPQADGDASNALVEVDENGLIALEKVENEGIEHEAYAVEGDWHDIPSLKSLIKKDVILVTDRIFSELEKSGGFFVVKEAFKKVLPAQYTMLKELREIITEKNSVKDL
jgi:hypothetical protein